MPIEIKEDISWCPKTAFLSSEIQEGREVFYEPSSNCSPFLFKEVGGEIR